MQVLRDRKRKLLAPFCMCVIVCAGSLFAAGQRAPERSARFRVVVSDSTDDRPLEGVRVFILSADGKTLADGTTDESGEVMLRKPLESDHPSFVLAEKKMYFIAGVRWDSHFDERLILVTPLALM